MKTKLKDKTNKYQTDWPSSLQQTDGRTAGRTNIDHWPKTNRKEIAQIISSNVPFGYCCTLLLSLKARKEHKKDFQKRNNKNQKNNKQMRKSHPVIYFPLVMF